MGTTTNRLYRNFPSNGTDPHLERVEVGPVNDEALRGWYVHPYWQGVDRKYTGGFILGSLRTAMRLAQAIADGAVYYDHEIRPTIGTGETFVSARSRVMARYANADLKRLGY
jgi:hypothetical protein